MVQLINVRFSEYHARYSPLIKLSLTVTFFACQKASLVSNLQLFISTFSTYWKEYFPLNVTFSKTISEDLMRKYSDSAEVLVILRPFTDQPNSGEMMEESMISASKHSRRAFMPWSFVLLIFMLSEYHNAARHLSVISLELILRP